MTINFKQKILALFLIFTLLIIFVTAFIYYSLLVRDIRKRSGTQITNAFEMMIDGFTSQAQQAVPRIERFITDSLIPPLYSLYERFDRYAQSEDEQLLPVWDEANLHTWNYIQGYILRGTEIVESIRNIVPILGIREYVLYDRDRIPMVVYQHTPDFEQLGMYLPRLRNGTFVPLLTEKDIDVATTWQNVQDITGGSLPGDIPEKYQKEIPAEPTAELSTKQQHITIKVTVPIVYRGEFEGACMIHLDIPQHDIKRYARFSQTQINLFVGSTLSTGTLPSYRTIQFDQSLPYHHFNLLHPQNEIPDIDVATVVLGKEEYYQGRMGFGDQKTGLGVMTANFSRAIEKHNAQELLFLISVTTLFLTVIGAITTYILSARITRPVTHITNLLWQITEGDVTSVMKDTTYREHKGRFRTVLAQKQPVNDEIAMLSQSFYAMSGYLLDIAELAENISLGEISQHITPRSKRDVLGNAFAQMLDYLHEMASIADTIAKGDLTSQIMTRSQRDAFGQAMHTMTKGLQTLIQQIRTSAEQIAETGATIASMTTQEKHLVQNVQESVSEMVTTMTQMKQSVDDVAQNMELLASAVEETLTSVSDTTTSMSDIAANTRELAQQTQEMITDLTDALQMLEHVTEKTNASNQLSQETIQDALEGQHAVEQVRESMDKIQHTNQKAEDTITRFAQRSQEIGTILDVIHDVTEQSSLLALNASIIAAQAGSHGRGFSVIAEEMRNLANEVGASTKNISAIVQTLQQDTTNVVKMIHEGTTNIEEGVSRTQQAQQRLEKIIASARRSSDVVSEIADALNMQTTTSQKVMKTMEHVHTSTTEITSSTNKQRITTMQIQDAVEHISELASQTHHDTREQLSGVKLVLNAADTVKNLSDQNMESSQGINHATTTELAEQAQILLQSVDRFRL